MNKYYKNDTMYEIDANTVKIRKCKKSDLMEPCSFELKDVVCIMNGCTMTLIGVFGEPSFDTAIIIFVVTIVLRGAMATATVAAAAGVAAVGIDRVELLHERLVVQVVDLIHTPRERPAAAMEVRPPGSSISIIVIVSVVAASGAVSGHAVGIALRPLRQRLIAGQPEATHAVLSQRG
jgi:hypothetical protein